MIVYWLYPNKPAKNGKYATKKMDYKAEFKNEDDPAQTRNI